MKQIVTLISDFWFEDSVLNSMKYIFKKNGIEALDIDHRIQRNNIFQGAYILNSVLKHYDRSVFHVNLVGVKDSETDHLVYFEADEFRIITPDNSFFNMLNLKNISLVSTTSYARQDNSIDCYSYIDKVIEIIKNYSSDYIKSMNDSLHIIKKMNRPKIKIINGNKLICDIVYVNYWNNVIVNITKNEFEELIQGRNFRYEYLPNEYVNTISNNCTEVGNGKVFMIFNYSGHLEIGVLGGNFANLIRAHTLSNCDFKTRGDILFKNHSISISFEN